MNKIALFISMLLLAACAQPNQSSNQPLTVPVAIRPAPTQEVEAPRCNTIDTCTYVSSGLGKKPLYNCMETTYEFSEHPEIPVEYFDGKECVTAREDFESVQGMCGPPNMPFPCQYDRQGPGPKAIPEI